VLNRAAEKVTTEWEGVKRDRVQQWCLIEIDGLPSAFQVTVNPGEEFKPGDYELDPKSFSVERGRLSMPRAILRPARPVVAAKG